MRLNHRIHAAEVQKASAAFLCVLEAQKLAKREAEEEVMAEKEKSMVEKILDTERAGYAYFYPSDGGNRQEFFICIHSKNKPPAMQVCPQTALASSKKTPLL